MLLRTGTLKPNGLQDATAYWYVASEYKDENGQDCFTCTMNRNRAMAFTKSEAERFNKKYLQMGRICHAFIAV